MIIRKAVPADAKSIADVHVASWRTTYKNIVPDSVLDGLDVNQREQQWHNALTKHAARNVLYIAEKNGQIIAFADGGAERGEVEGYDAELYAIYALQGAQGKGIGRRLVEAVVSDLHDLGHNSMMVWVLKDNPACGFYERLGGKHITEKTITMSNTDLIEIAYGWQDISTLIKN